VRACLWLVCASIKEGTMNAILNVSHPKQNLGEGLVQLLRCVQRSGAPRLNSARIDPFATNTWDETLWLFSFALPRCEHHLGSHLTTLSKQ